MSATTKLYLCHSEWPSRDQTLWKRAFEPKIDPFDDGGPGAHLSERTVQQLEYAYGKFLYFVSAEHSDLLKRAPACRLSAKIIKEYASWQPETCRGGNAQCLSLPPLACATIPLSEKRLAVAISRQHAN
jgi:hypothetical protein